MLSVDIFVAASTADLLLLLTFLMVEEAGALADCVLLHFVRVVAHETGLIMKVAGRRWQLSLCNREGVATDDSGRYDVNFNETYVLLDCDAISCVIKLLCVHLMGLNDDVNDNLCRGNDSAARSSNCADLCDITRWSLAILLSMHCSCVSELNRRCTREISGCYYGGCRGCPSSSSRVEVKCEVEEAQKRRQDT